MCCQKSISIPSGPSGAVVSIEVSALHCNWAAGREIGRSVTPATVASY